MVFVATGKLDGDTLGNIHGLYGGLGGGHDLAHWHILDSHTHGYDTFTVLTLDGGRAEALHYGAHVAHTHRAACGIVDEDVLDVLYRSSAFGLVHHFDIVFLAVLTEARSQLSVDAVSQICSGSAEIEAIEGELLAVEVDLEFRLVVGT